VSHSRVIPGGMETLLNCHGVPPTAFLSTVASHPEVLIHAVWPENCMPAVLLSGSVLLWPCTGAAGAESVPAGTPKSSALSAGLLRFSAYLPCMFRDDSVSLLLCQNAC
jgi:hypothetical protein